MNLNYLKELGYTDEAIKEYSSRWNENIISYLAEYSENVSLNMRYLIDDFDKDLLLKLPAFYKDTFVLSPEMFQERMQLFKNEFPDEWSEIIEKQFWGYSGIAGTNYKPFLEAAGSSDDLDVEKAIGQLKKPWEITYEFMVLLSEKAGISLSAQDCHDYALLDLEESKNEVVRNAEYLIDAGLSLDIVASIICNAPYLMMLSEMEVKDRLIDGFGEDFIASMQVMDEDSFLEKLDEIGG